MVDNCSKNATICIEHQTLNNTDNVIYGNAITWSDRKIRLFSEQGNRVLTIALHIYTVEQEEEQAGAELGQAQP